jgi:cytochrome c oxidase subunit 2
MRILSAFFPIVTADASTPWQLGFQDPASPTMQGIVDLHHDIMFFIVGVVVFVTYMMVRCLMHFTDHPAHLGPDGVTHGTTIEIIWTITPSIILVLIALPSFALLYSMDEIIDPSLTLKVVGHQWYWTYEYSDYAQDDDTSLVYDSYMVPEDELETGALRLLEVDNRVVLPVHTPVRVLITSADVLHCWAVPSLGVKCDAVPGRLNQISVFINREGIFYGQCSEICGTNHGFMPIVVEGVTADNYLQWVKTKLEDL